MIIHVLFSHFISCAINCPARSYSLPHLKQGNNFEPWRDILFGMTWDDIEISWERIGSLVPILRLASIFFLKFTSSWMLRGDLNLPDLTWLQISAWIWCVSKSGLSSPHVGQMKSPRMPLSLSLHDCSTSSESGSHFKVSILTPVIIRQNLTLDQMNNKVQKIVALKHLCFYLYLTM